MAERATWQPRCEGCGSFVSQIGHHPSGYRWCAYCEVDLPNDPWKRRWMVDRLEVDRHGFAENRRRREAALSRTVEAGDRTKEQR